MPREIQRRMWEKLSGCSETNVSHRQRACPAAHTSRTYLPEGKTIVGENVVWWARQDLNLGPMEASIKVCC